MAHVDSKKDSLTGLVYPTLGEIEEKIPKHCFEPILTKSFAYAAFDLAIVLGAFAGFYVLWGARHILPIPVFWLAYVVYAFVQGTNFWACFVMGHDCGHGSFSKSETINHSVGLFFHTIILTPYYPWKLSHNAHHKKTGNIDEDEIFYPVRAGPYEYCKDNSSNALRTLGLAWFGYLAIGFAPRWKWHFSLFNPLHANFKLEVFVDLVVYGLFLGLLTKIGAAIGYPLLILSYVVPLFIFASWLVLVTFLHHQQPGTPWWGKSDWDYVKGNMSSIDRNYGIFHWWTHNIGTHQVHHLFPRIPHYHLIEATAAFRKAFPQFVQENHGNQWTEYFKMVDMYQKHGTVRSGDTNFMYPKKLE